jgi:spore coat protein U-like protein
MKKLFVSILVIAASTAFPSEMMGQISSTATNIGVDAKVIAPISIENAGSSSLNFGTISRSSSSGTVIMDTDGDRTVTGGVAVLASPVGTTAQFTVSGENSVSYNITLPADNAVKLIRAGGSEEMEITDFESNSTLVLSSTGTASFAVGATLNVDADQVAGDYHTTFAVTVAYN